VQTIAHRDLRNNSSEILRAVAQGESFEITNHGDVVAMLVPAATRGGAPLRMIPATRQGGWSDLPLVKLDHPVQDDLDYLRGER